MGLFRRHAQVSTVALQIYMVAGSYRCPILRAGGFRIDPRAFGSSLATMADASCMPGAAELSLFPEEEPPPQDVHEWLINRTIDSVGRRIGPRHEDGATLTPLLQE